MIKKSRERSDFIEREAQRLGVSVVTLYRWIKKYGEEKALKMKPQTRLESQKKAAAASPWRYRRYGKGYDLSKGSTKC